MYNKAERRKGLPDLTRTDKNYEISRQFQPRFELTERNLITLPLALNCSLVYVPHYRDLLPDLGRWEFSFHLDESSHLVYVLDYVKGSLQFPVSVVRRLSM